MWALGMTGKFLSLSSSVPALRKLHLGTSLVVQWLTLHAPSVGDQGLIPSQ